MAVIRVVKYVQRRQNKTKSI